MDLTSGKDSKTSTGSSPPGPSRACRSISSSFSASAICSAIFSLALFLMRALNATNSSSKAFLYYGSATWILKKNITSKCLGFAIWRIFLRLTKLYTYLLKNEEIHDLGSTSNCLDNSKRYWIQMHWCATCSIAPCLSCISRLRQWITK